MPMEGGNMAYMPALYDSVCVFWFSDDDNACMVNICK